MVCVMDEDISPGRVWWTDGWGDGWVLRTNHKG
jgi:hypothetical protein